VNCKFLNFGVNIEKALKLHRLKMHFPLSISCSLNKVFGYSFLVMMRNVEILGFCSVMDRAGRLAIKLITS
jgi:hypothetical protein